jgi:A/G-specific adenine glycosylase
LLLHGNDILLEKRAPSGIWGGLWCPPQLEGKQVADYLQGNGVQASEAIELAEFTHAFTHYKLHITPVLMRVMRKPSQARQPGSMWFDVKEALQAAIPAPVRRVLEELLKNHFWQNRETK